MMGQSHWKYAYEEYSMPWKSTYNIMFFREKNTKYMSKVLKYGLFVCLDILEINT